MRTTPGVSDVFPAKKELRGPNHPETLRRTVRWYLDNPEWVARVRNGEYPQWMEKHYGPREPHEN